MGASSSEMAEVLPESSSTTGAINDRKVLSSIYNLEQDLDSVFYTDNIIITNRTASGRIIDVALRVLGGVRFTGSFAVLLTFLLTH